MLLVRVAGGLLILLPPSCAGRWVVGAGCFARPARSPFAGHPVDRSGF